MIPPALHESIIDLALARGMHILSEKPIADTMEASVRIADKVKAAGRKMAVTMSHRFDQDKSTLRGLVRGDTLGRINTVSCRRSSDYRVYDSWRRFRHEMANPTLIEGAVHHLDIMADLAGAPCTSVFARSWKPEWAEYKGDTDVMAVMEFANGARGIYEGSAAHATGLNDWTLEYFRVEAESGTAILDHRDGRGVPPGSEANLSTEPARKRPAGVAAIWEEVAEFPLDRTISAVGSTAARRWLQTLRTTCSSWRSCSPPLKVLGSVSPSKYSNSFDRSESALKLSCSRLFRIRLNG